MAKALEHLNNHVLDYAQMLGIIHERFRQPVDLGKFASPSFSRGATGHLERGLHVGTDAKGKVKV